MEEVLTRTDGPFLTVPSKRIKFLRVLYSILAVTRQSRSGGMLEAASSNVN